MDEEDAIDGDRSREKQQPVLSLEVEPVLYSTRLWAEFQARTVRLRKRNSALMLIQKDLSLFTILDLVPSNLCLDFPDSNRRVAATNASSSYSWTWRGRVISHFAYTPLCSSLPGRRLRLHRPFISILILVVDPSSFKRTTFVCQRTQGPYR
jgi:hypothetical protein